MNAANMRLGRADQLTALLKERCALLPAGERFLSVRQIMAEYNVSQITVKQALDRLCSAGMLAARERSGYYIRPMSGRKVAVIMPLAADGRLSGSFYEQYESVIGALKEAGLESESVFYTGDNAEALLLLNEIRADAVFLIPFRADDFSAPLLNRIMAHPTPVFLLFASPKSTNCRFVDGANEFAGTLAASHLLINGHRKLAVMVSEPKLSIVRERVDGFLKTASAFHVPVEVLDPEIASGENSPEKSRRFFVEYLQQHHGRLKFSAMFVISSDPANEILHVALEQQVRVPEDLSLITLGRPDKGKYNFTTIDTRRHEIARAGVKLLRDYFARTPDAPMHIIVTPEIHDGKTVLDLNAWKSSGSGSDLLNRTRKNGERSDIGEEPLHVAR